MKNQAYRMAMLFDFYGDLLTERQREFYDLYYNEDLSLAEIAENYGISRQGVRDVIVRAEAAMTEIEDKTHIIRRFQQSKAAIAAIDAAADQLLRAVDKHSYNDVMLDGLARAIKENVAKLEQE
ncbi:MAG: DNA-binding protein [Oscillospiraceae bacterium]|nr:DNA-binding protein [Oscillospiraceae bacterium]MDE7171558.1 DNA-binding protein [Oscillospiraceae bacterium]